MTKEELIEIVGIVRANWNLHNMDRDSTKGYLEAWWRYLEPLDYEATLGVVDSLVLWGGPPPKVGDVVRRVLGEALEGGAPPPVSQAVLEAKGLVEAADAGIPPDRQPHPLVVEALRRLRERAVGFTYKGFEDEYQATVAEKMKG